MTLDNGEETQVGEERKERQKGGTQGMKDTKDSKAHQKKVADYYHIGWKEGRRMCGLKGGKLGRKYLLTLSGSFYR